VTFTAAVAPGTATGKLLSKTAARHWEQALSVPARQPYHVRLSTGSHSLTAVYAGDVNHYGCTSSTLTQTVNKITTTVNLASSSIRLLTAGQ